MCSCKASWNHIDVKLHFRQENLLSKLLGIGLVLRLERQKATERKIALFISRNGCESDHNDTYYSHPILVKGLQTVWCGCQHRPSYLKALNAFPFKREESKTWVAILISLETAVCSEHIIETSIAIQCTCGGNLGVYSVLVRILSNEKLM